MMGSVERSSGAVGVDTQEALAGKYLTFELNGEKYGMGILQVQEIIALMDVTTVPQMPAFIRGIINLRGQIIPVIDLNVKFGAKERADGERPCIVVIQIALHDKEITMGVLVDSVSDVTYIAAEQIEDTPSFGVAVDTEFIRGIGKTDDGVTILLDVDRLLSGEDLDDMQGSVNQHGQ